MITEKGTELACNCFGLYWEPHGAHGRECDSSRDELRVSDLPAKNSLRMY